MNRQNHKVLSNSDSIIKLYKNGKTLHEICCEYSFISKDKITHILSKYIKENMVQFYLDELANGKASTISFLRQKFGTCEEFTRNCMKKHIEQASKCDEFIKDKNGDISYITREYLVKNTGFTIGWIDANLKKHSIPFIFLPVYLPLSFNRTKIWHKKFYHLQTIFQKLPQFKKNYFDINNYRSPVTKKRPKGMYKWTYIIFCAMLLIKIDTDIWPSVQELIKFTKRKYSRQTIYRSINELIENGYLTHKHGKYSDLIIGRRAFIVNSGPKELVYESENNKRLYNFCAKNCTSF
jgi:hypothetical protein